VRGGAVQRGGLAGDGLAELRNCAEGMAGRRCPARRGGQASGGAAHGAEERGAPRTEGMRGATHNGAAWKR
jgi:hypothetical protein